MIYHDEYIVESFSTTTKHVSKWGKTKGGLSWINDALLYACTYGIKELLNLLLPVADNLETWITTTQKDGGSNQETILFDGEHTFFAVFARRNVNKIYLPWHAHAHSKNSSINIKIKKFRNILICK